MHSQTRTFIEEGIIQKKGKGHRFCFGGKDFIQFLTARKKLLLVQKIPRSLRSYKPTVVPLLEENLVFTLPFPIFRFVHIQLI